MNLELKYLSPYLPYGLRYTFDNLSYWETGAGLLYTGDRFDLGTLIRLTDPTQTPNVIGVKWDDDKNGLSALFELGSPHHKPILRPMSDLTKEVAINHVKMIPLIEICHKFRKEAYWTGDGGAELIDCAVFDGKKVVEHDAYESFWTLGYHEEAQMFYGHIDMGDGETELNISNQYDMFQMLFEFHFDVFGLIPSNLAIDINTLNQKS